MRRHGRKICLAEIPVRPFACPSQAPGKFWSACHVIGKWFYGWVSKAQLHQHGSEFWIWFKSGALRVSSRVRTPSLGQGRRGIGASPLRKNSAIPTPSLHGDGKVTSLIERPSQKISAPPLVQISLRPVETQKFFESYVNAGLQETAYLIKSFRNAWTFT